MTQDHTSDAKVAWPKCDILWAGYFGSGTPEGQRYRNRTLTSLAVMFAVLAGVALMHPVSRPTKLFVSLLPGATFGYIAWEWWRYIGNLDELARRLQVEAMAIGGVCIFMNWDFSPYCFMILEPVRGFRLWALTRKY